jgi:hypothetical protein
MSMLGAMQPNGGVPVARLRKGMRVAMNDGWTGKFSFVDREGFVHIDEPPPNIHLTGRVIRRSFLTIVGETIAGDWKSAVSSSRNRAQRHSVVIADLLKRAQLASEWKYAPED